MKFNDLYNELMSESMSKTEQELYDKFLDTLGELRARNAPAFEKLMARIKEIGDYVDYKPVKSIKTIRMSSDPRDASWIG